VRKSASVPSGSAGARAYQSGESCFPDRAKTDFSAIVEIREQLALCKSTDDYDQVEIEAKCKGTARRETIDAITICRSW